MNVHCVCTYMCVYVCMYMYMYVHVCVCLCVYVCVCMFVCLCVYLFMYATERREDYTHVVRFIPHVFLCHTSSALCSHDVQVQLESVPHPRDMETALASRFVFTLASSPPDQPMLKSFLYSQNVSGARWGVCPLLSHIFAHTCRCPRCTGFLLR